jgi:hypothetical protein
MTGAGPADRLVHDLISISDPQPFLQLLLQLAYNRVDVRHGVAFLVFHDRRTRSVRCCFDQKIRNISVITRDGAVVAWLDLPTASSWKPACSAATSFHSITSSARTRMLSGIVSPSA